MPPEARREQLLGVTLALVAEQGWLGLDLDQIAARADVSRNLIYHYFPRGRIDLFGAAIDQAGAELSAGWLSDERLPLEQRMAANFSRFTAHALEPSDPWMAYRQGNGGDPEIEAAGERYRAKIVAAIAANHLGTQAPDPLARLALRSYLDFAERALDECRERSVDPERVTELLRETLLAVVGSLRPS